MINKSQEEVDKLASRLARFSIKKETNSYENVTLRSRHQGASTEHNRILTTEEECKAYHNYILSLKLEKSEEEILFYFRKLRESILTLDNLIFIMDIYIENIELILDLWQVKGIDNLIKQEFVRCIVVLIEQVFDNILKKEIVLNKEQQNKMMIYINYYLLIKLNTKDIFFISLYINKLNISSMEHPSILSIQELVSTINQSNYIKFFKLVKEMDTKQRLLIEYIIETTRKNVFLIYYKAYYKYPLSLFLTQVGFEDSKECLLFLNINFQTKYKLVDESSNIEFIKQRKIKK